MWTTHCIKLQMLLKQEETGMTKYIVFKQDREGFRTVIATTTSKNITEARKYAVKMYLKDIDMMQGEKLAVARA